MRISLLFVATTILISSGLQAEEPVEKKKFHPLMGDRHTFILGVYNQDADAEFYADAGDIGGGSVNLGDLGMNEDYTSGMVEYRFRLNDKWLFSVGGYRFNTDGTLGVRRPFVYDGQEFEAGVTDIAETILRVFHQAAFQKLAYPRWRIVREIFQGRLGAEDGGQTVGDGLAAEDATAGEAFVEHTAEGPDITASVHLTAPCLLGAHVGGGAHDHALLGMAGCHGG